MIRALLLRIAGACCRALPPMWARAASAEAEHISGTGALARALLVLPAMLAASVGARLRRSS